MRKDPRPPWKRPAPPSKGGAAGRLSPAQKEAARQRAEAAGRRYPNLVDNMWAMRLPSDGRGSGVVHPPADAAVDDDFLAGEEP